MAARTTKSPWTPERVTALNKRQKNPSWHPYTCGGNRCDAAHVQHAEQHNDRDYGVLVATPNGWVCPVCGYRQDWAHTADTTGEFRQWDARVADPSPSAGERE